MQLEFKFPPLDGKKTERLSIAVSKDQVDFLHSLIKQYKERGTIISPSEFAYVCFVEGMKKAIQFLSYPDSSKKIF